MEKMFKLSQFGNKSNKVLENEEEKMKMNVQKLYA